MGEGTGWGRADDGYGEVVVTACERVVTAWEGDVTAWEGDVMCPQTSRT